MMHVVPCRWLMSSSRFMTSTVLRESRSPVGSSRSSRSGWFARARAMVTRCCSPPDSSEGRCSMRSPRPTMVRRRRARWLRRAGGSRLSSAMGSSTFSKADMVASRLKDWNTNPILRSLRLDRKWSLARLSTCFPNSLRTPPVGLSMHPIRFKSVVFPPPLGPRSMTNSPFLTGYNSLSCMRLISSNAVTSSPPANVYFIDMCSSSTMSTPSDLYEMTASSPSTSSSYSCSPTTSWLSSSASSPSFEKKSPI
mmetsp:Transcript_11221/g.31253  ORF Transcript_11221/g.31253 Transcript_11221/m.31253 type:complete len:252 (+) Transcript_11221:677-1432(+)